MVWVSTGRRVSDRAERAIVLARGLAPVHLGAVGRPGRQGNDGVDGLAGLSVGARGDSPAAAAGAGQRVDKGQAPAAHVLGGRMTQGWLRGNTA